MAKRRPGAIPQRVCLTQDTTDQIDAYQRQQQIPSFSATVETLVRIGLGRPPLEQLTPVLVSTMRQTMRREMERLVKLQLYTAIEAGIAQRFAAAAVRDVGRLKQDAPSRYQAIKEAAIADARRHLARDNIGAVVAELYMEVADGDRPGELHPAGQRSPHSGQEGA